MSSEFEHKFIDPEFRARLAQLIGNDKPFAWAARVGIERGTFSRIWNSGSVPKGPILKLIREKVGVSIDWLLTGEGPMLDERAQYEGTSREAVAKRVAVMAGSGREVALFAQRAGVPESVVQEYLDGKRDLTDDITERFSRAGSQPLAWVARGGTAPITMQQIAEIPIVIDLSGKGEPNPSATIGDVDVVMVQQINVEASMGPGAINGEEETIAEWPFTLHYLMEVGVAPKNAALIAVRGDSMSPTIADGDLVLVNRAVRQPKGDGIYVIRLGGELFAKRLQIMADGGLVIRSDNPSYAPEIIPPGQTSTLYIRGRVVSRLGRL